MPFPKETYHRRAPTAAHRNQFSGEVRELIYERDDHCCIICGKWSSIIHHVMYRSQSGRGVFSNGVVLCSHCHCLVHDNFVLAQKIRDRARKQYGDEYYMDRWDLHDCH